MTDLTAAIIDGKIEVIADGFLMAYGLGHIGLDYSQLYLLQQKFELRFEQIVPAVNWLRTQDQTAQLCIKDLRIIDYDYYDDRDLDLLINSLIPSKAYTETNWWLILSKEWR